MQLESKYDLEDTKSFYITHLSLHFWSNYICVNIFLDGYDKIMRLCLQAISPTTHYLDMHKKNDQPMNPEFTFFVLINAKHAGWPKGRKGPFGAFQPFGAAGALRAPAG